MVTEREVLGLALPPRLVDLSETEVWRAVPKTEAFSQLLTIKRPKRWDAYDVRGIERESAHLPQLAADPRRADLYGFAHEAITRDPAHGPALDPNMTLVIMGSLDEEVVCLDYATPTGVPRVVRSIHVANTSEWQEIAKDFDGFGAMIGLV
jgi:hypothetical protein